MSFKAEFDLTTLAQGNQKEATVRSIRFQIQIRIKMRTTRPKEMKRKFNINTVY